MPQYLDENGNPVSQGKTYLDPNTGEPVGQAAEQPPGVPAAPIPAGLTGKSSPNYANMALQAGEAVKGAGKGMAHTLSVADDWARKKLPAVMTNSYLGFGKPADLEAEKQMQTPTNTAQKIGYGGEQIGEFLLPGGAEKKGAAAIAEHLPQLGKYAAPLAKVATSALSSGAVNAAQGGSPWAGAAMGAGGAAVGEGLKAAAPMLTGIAQGLHPEDYGKTGKAILGETRGVFPGQIRNSARGVLDKLNPELDQMAKNASERPNMAKAMLPGPSTEIPLSEPWIPDTKGELIPAKAFPRGNIVGGSSPRVAAELGSTEATIPPRLTRDDLFMHSGVRPTTELPTSGPGVLIRPFEAPAGGLPATIPNPSVSLTQPRQVASDLTKRAFGQNESKMYKGVSKMARMVNQDLEGNPLPENITPYQALELKRGIGKAQPKGSWNPESANAFKGPRTALYKAVNDEFLKSVPDAGPLNSRISSLIPATEKPQNIFWGHTLGPGVGALYGGLRGARSDGWQGAAQGAAEGAAAGLLFPAALNTVARGANSPALQRVIMPSLVGGALQTTRKKKE